MAFPRIVNLRLFRWALVLTLMGALVAVPTSAAAHDAGSGRFGVAQTTRASAEPCTQNPDVCAPDGEVIVEFFRDPEPACTFNANIDWGDGTSTAVPDFQNGQQVSHTFAVGFYTVDITGNATSSDPEVTCTFFPSSFTVEVPLIITPPVPPDAVKDVHKLSKNGALTSDVLGNDFRGLCCEEPNRLPFNLLVDITRAPRHGTAALEQPAGHVYEPEDPALFTYTPNADFCGIDSFVYHMRPPNDDIVVGDRATVFILVCPKTLTDELAERIKKLPLTNKENKKVLKSLNAAQEAFEDLKLNLAISHLEDVKRKVKRFAPKSDRRAKALKAAQDLINAAKGRA